MGCSWKTVHSCGLLLFAAGLVWWMTGKVEKETAAAGGLAGVEVGGSADADAGDVFAAFDDFRRRLGGGGEETVGIEAGVAAAKARMEALSVLMRSDPAAALERVMGLGELAALPEELRRHCERPLSVLGDVDLLWAASEREDGRLDCRHENRLWMDGRSWPVFGTPQVAGRPPRSGLPINGWLIDGGVLTDGAAVWQLAGGEAEPAGEWFEAGNPDGLDPLSGRPADPAVAAVIGGRVVTFESEASIARVSEILTNADRAAGRGRELRHGLAWLEAFGGDSAGGGGPVEATPWMDDMIDVLFIRVNFSDFPGEPVSKAALESTLSTVAGHLNNYSYAEASLAYTVTSQLYRMPDSGQSYALAGDNDGLMADARALAAANYTLSNYDVVAVFFPSLAGISGSQITYSGLASIGGDSHWVNGSNSVGVILHEFGHNYGLRHANYWDPGQGIAGSYNDPAASSLEYGDIFDTMGGGSATKGYFNPYTTNQLDWLPDSKVATATADGTWRIHRFDDGGALSNQYLALRVPVGGGVHYWVCHRRLYGSPYNLENGAYVVAEGLYPSNYGTEQLTNLIDMTPGSASPESADRADAGLTSAAPFEQSGVTIRVVAAGGVSPNQWIDVAVGFESRVSIVDTTPEVDEQSGVAYVTLARTFGGGGAASVDFQTSNGTAVAGTDYYARSGKVEWADGDSSDKTIAIAIRPDGVNEWREDFTLTLANEVGVVLDPGADTATVRILDAGVKYEGFAPAFFNTSVYAIAPLPDGKVLIGGNIGAGIGSVATIRHLARLNADGSVDEGFLTGSGFNGPVWALAVQPDGRILAGGEFTSYNGTACNRLVRLTSNGSVDGAFVAAMGSGADNTVRALAVETGGTILVGGSLTGFNGTAVPGLVRLTSGGARDAANALNLGYSGGTIRAVLAQDDGRIMVGGFLYYGWTPSGWRSGVARLHSNGSRDASFDPDAGAHVAGSTDSLGTVYSLDRLPDGRYLVGGSFTAFDEHPATRVAMVEEDGSPVTTFSPPAFNNVVHDVLAQASGKAVVGGWFTSPVSGLERLGATGGADGGFQQGSGPAGSVYAVEEGVDGELWVGGNFFSYDGVSSRPVVKVAGGQGVYERWAAGRFSAGEVVAGDSAADADPDGDGIENLAEMAIGSDPKLANGDRFFSPSGPGGIELVAGGGGIYLQVTLDKAAMVTGIWLTAQFSGDLMNWLPASPQPGSNAIYDVIEDSGERIVIRDKTPVSGTLRRFVRLVATQPW